MTTSHERRRRRRISLLAPILALACREPPKSTPRPAPSPAHERWRTIPAGVARVGAPISEACRRPEDPPVREVEIGHRLLVATTEVSQAEFAARLGFDPSAHGQCPDCPVDSVTFDEAARYCNTLSKEAALEPCYRCAASDEADGVRCRAKRAPASCPGYRLPTSDEWEYLARAGTDAPTHAGEVLACMSRDRVADRVAWYKANSGGWTHPGAALEPNPWGLFDVLGNVFEWVDDSASSERRDFGLLAGGSWYHNAERLRAASRLRVPHERRLAYAGFRCVQTLDVEPGPPLELAPIAADDDEPATQPEPSSLRPEPLTVAAIALTSAAPRALVPECRDDTCVVDRLIREAAAHGAKLIVSPEYALAQGRAEPCPELGDAPARDAPPNSLLARFARVADEVDAYVVINLETREDRGARYNTAVAFDPDGLVVGRHHKFELYGGEREELTAGREVSTFTTPYGRVGLLTCADIYGRPLLHDELTHGLDARIVAWSALWTVAGARRWQSTFARDWKVFLVAANGAGGEGEGAGVYGPTGESLERRDRRWPILYAEIRDER